MNGKKRWLIWLLCAALLPGCGLRSTDAPATENSPSPVSAATPAPEIRSAAERQLERMTLREKVGQLFIVRPDALDPTQPTAQVDDSNAPGVTELTADMAEMLAAYPVGGVAMFSKNIADPDQLTAFIAQLQEQSSVGLFLAVDEEGGIVTRLASNSAFALPRFRSAAAVGAGGDDAAAREMGRTIGAYLRQYGFQMDFAPVADVSTNPDNPVIGSRAFSSRADVAGRMASAMAGGLLEEGVIPVYKHFPGHGDTAEDSHRGLAVTYKTAEELSACEWIPYTGYDLSGCAVMVGHIAAPELTGDMTPSSLSPAVVTGILREQMGFDGLIMTDSLAMGAIARSYPPGDAAVLALLAGCDVLLLPEDLPVAFETVLHAVESGVIPAERLDESVRRVLEYKARAGLLPPAD